MAGAIGGGPVATNGVLTGVATSESTLGFPTTVVIFKLNSVVFPRLPPPVVTVDGASKSEFEHLPVRETANTAIVATASVGAPAMRDGVITDTGTVGAHFSPVLFVVTLRVAIMTPIYVGVPSGAPTIEVHGATKIASFAPSIVAIAISFGSDPPGGPPAVTPVVELCIKRDFLVVGDVSGRDPVGTPVTIVRCCLMGYFVVLAAYHAILSVFSFMGSNYVTSSDIAKGN